MLILNEKQKAERSMDWWAAKNLENAAEFMRKGTPESLKCALFLIKEIKQSYDASGRAISCS